MSSSLNVTRENNSTSDFVVNAYGAIIATDRLIDRSILMDVKPEQPLPIDIKIRQKQVVKILMSSSLRLSFLEPYKTSNLKISFSTTKTLQHSEIYNEIDTTCFRIANGRDGRRCKSDFTTIKKMTDFFI